MPKDWQLLPPHSQDLLRAARSGDLHNQSTDEKAKDKVVAAAAAVAAGKGKKPAETPKKEEQKAPTEGFRAKAWRQIARNDEGPTISHLAKRRKGTIRLAPKAERFQTAAVTITTAKVRRYDAVGNPYEQTITLSEGQEVNGEIISTSVVAIPAAEGSSQQPSPNRRKPPPRRKPKGAGRGRKKKLLPLPPVTRPVPGPDRAKLDGLTVEVGLIGTANENPSS